MIIRRNLQYHVTLVLIMLLQDPGVYFQDVASKIFPNGTMLFKNGTVTEASVFWGAMDPRNPKSITSLKTFLGDQIPDGTEINLELLTKLDQKLTESEAIKKHLKSEEQNKVSNLRAGLDILSDYSERSVELVKNIIDMKKLEKCSEVLACKVKTILGVAPLENLLLSSNCTERQLENNICN